MDNERKQISDIKAFDTRNPGVCDGWLFINCIDSIWVEDGERIGVKVPGIPVYIIGYDNLDPQAEHLEIPGTFILDGVEYTVVGIVNRSIGQPRGYYTPLFCNLSNLKSLSFPDTLTVFKGNTMFCGLPSLKCVRLPKNLIMLSTERIFCDCPELTDVWVHKGLRRITHDAFENCGDLVFHLEGFSAFFNIDYSPNGSYSENWGTILDHLDTGRIPKMKFTDFSDHGLRVFKSFDVSHRYNLPHITLDRICDYLYHPEDIMEVEENWYDLELYDQDLFMLRNLRKYSAGVRCRGLGIYGCSDSLEILELQGPVGIYSDVYHVHDIQVLPDSPWWQEFVYLPALEEILTDKSKAKHPDMLYRFDKYDYPIDKYAFFGCTKLRKVELPQGTTEIGECAFANCKSLSEVNIPKSVKSIGSMAFANCDSLKEVVIANPDCKIAPDAFPTHTVRVEG